MRLLQRIWLRVALPYHLQLGLLVGPRCLLVAAAVPAAVVAGGGGWHLDCDVLGDLEELEGFGELEGRQVVLSQPQVQNAQIVEVKLRVHLPTLLIHRVLLG